MTAKEQSIAFLQFLPRPDHADAPPQPYVLSATTPTTLGRDFRCQIPIDPTVYRSVSRRHAEITPVEGIETPDSTKFWQICDLGSSNGTYVNGVRLQQCQVLRTGDRISLGQNGPEFLFERQTGLNPPAAVFSAPPAIASPPAIPLVSYTSRPSLHRPPEGVSLTQLFPILSTGRELTRKAYLIPAITTVLLVVALFLTIGNPTSFNLILAIYLASVAYFFIYQLCGKHKPLWILASTACATALMLISPALDLFILIFHRILPGDISTTTSTTPFVITLIKIFFGAGLMEELFKAIPVLVAFWIRPRLRSPLRQQLGVWEPLDGILLGAATAVGFSLMETLGVYVPASYTATLGAGADAAQLAGLQLLIPRVLGLIAGHMAYSGYFGYFIGLSALHRRQRKLILGVGYLTAATLHTLWNAAGTLSPAVLAIVGCVSYALLGAAILKALVLSPTRSQNFATRFHP